MPSLSSLVGGGGVPVGGAIPLWAAPINPTYNGAEYLRMGSLKAISGYESFAASNLRASYALTAPKKAQGNTPYAGMRYGGGRYYITSGSAPRTTTALTTAWVATTGYVNASSVDGVVFGANVVYSGGAGTVTLEVFSGGTAATSVPSTSVMACGAVNAAGTLGAFFSTTNAANGGMTSTNGTAWTARTTTATDNTTVIVATWQAVSSTFVVLSNGATPYTCTDGFTLTKRSAITGVTGLTGIVAPTGLASDYAAYTATATFFSLSANITDFSGTVPVFAKSTDGVNFTAVLWSSLIPSVGSVAPRVFAVGNTLYAVGSIAFNNDQSVWHTSADNGATWTALPYIAPSALYIGNEYSQKFVAYANGEFVAYPGGTGEGTHGLVSTASLTATHVGSFFTASASGGAGISTVPYYLRIK